MSFLSQVIEELVTEILKENTIPAKVDDIQRLFIHLLSFDINSTNFIDIICKQVLPEIVNTQQTIYEENQQPLTKTYKVKDVHILKQHLKHALDLHNVMHHLISWVATKGKLSYEHTIIPITLNSFLFSTLMHCKHSADIYKNNFSSLNEITELFTATQSIQPKLLSSIENQFTFDLNVEGHQTTLIRILDGICDIGNIVFGLNLKSMALSWRCYSILIKRYGSNMNHYDAMKPLTILLNEVIKAFTNCVNNDKIPDEKNFKIYNFLLSIVRTILILFWGVCCNEINKYDTLELLVKLFQSGDGLDVTNKIVKFFKTQIYSQLQMSLCRLLRERDIYITGDPEKCHRLLEGSGLLVPYSKIFTIENDVITFLNNFIECLNLASQQSYYAFMKSENYSQILTNFVSTILPLSDQEYFPVEELLINNILEPSRQSSIFAHDLWVLVLRFAPPTLCFHTLTSITEKYKTNSSHEFKSGTRHILQSFLGHCYSILPESLQEKFLDLYKLEEFINVWRFSDVSSLPPRRKYLTQVLAFNLCKRNSSFNNNLDCVMDAFAVLTKLLDVTTHQQLLTNFKDLSQETQNSLNDLVIKLWRSDISLLTNEMYVHFLTNSWMPMMNMFINNFNCNNKDLLQILNQFKEHISSMNTKIISTQILLSIAKTPANEYNAITFSTINELLCSLTTTNPEIQQISSSSELQVFNLYANQVRVAFEDDPQWKKNLHIVQPSLNENEEIQATSAEIPTITSENLQDVKKRKEEEQIDPEVKKKMKFGEENPGTSYDNRNNSAKCTNEQDEAQDILDNIKDEVKRLQKLASNGKWEKVSKENSQSIYFILNKLKCFMYRS